MSKRAFERTLAELALHCFDQDDFGTAENLSENGMFITSKKLRFPLDTQFEISFPFKSEYLKVPVTIKRVTKSNGYYDGIGVQLLKPDQKYLNFVHEFKKSKKNRN